MDRKDVEGPGKGQRPRSTTPGGIPKLPVALLNAPNRGRDDSESTMPYLFSNQYEQINKAEKALYDDKHDLIKPRYPKGKGPVDHPVVPPRPLPGPVDLDSDRMKEMLELARRQQAERQAQRMREQSEERRVWEVAEDPSQSAPAGWTDEINAEAIDLLGQTTIAQVMARLRHRHNDLQGVSEAELSKFLSQLYDLWHKGSR